MRIGKKYCLGDFLGDTYQLLYSTTLAAAATSLTISGLDGNTDEEYLLSCRFVFGANGMIFLRPNNDASGANYGYQRLAGSNTTAYAERLGADSTYNAGVNLFASGVNSPQILHTETFMRIKSGNLRTFLTDCAAGIATTAVGTAESNCQVWNNTADNITSLVLAHSASNGLGIGTYIALYRKRAK